VYGAANVGDIAKLVKQDAGPEIKTPSFLTADAKFSLCSQPHLESIKLTVFCDFLHDFAHLIVGFAKHAG
jgi:hypothetical protein